MKNVFLVAAATFAVVFSAYAASERDYISIVGSSTVFPFATSVAERFGKMGKYKTPKVESMGTGGGIKLFCAGLGAGYPDMVNASRRIKKAEFESCARHGVTDIVEVLIGYDGIVLANAKTAPVLKVGLQEIYLALAKDVPDPKGGEKLVPNPYQQWQDINARLPAKKIEVLGPPPTSGTRDAFAEMVLEGGCKKIAWLKAMEAANENKFKAVCRGVREDGAYIEAGENDNLIVQKLAANTNVFGIFGFSFLEQSTDKVHGAIIEGQAPTFESIAEAAYPVSRPLFVYVKKAHVDKIPGIRGYLNALTSEQAWGSDGYLAEKGLIPLAADKRKEVKKSVALLTVLKLQ